MTIEKKQSMSILTQALVTSDVWCLLGHGIRWVVLCQVSSLRPRMANTDKTAARHWQIKARFQ